jgi:hypothetical protein
MIPRNGDGELIDATDMDRNARRWDGTVEAEGRWLPMSIRLLQNIRSIAYEEVQNGADERGYDLLDADQKVLEECMWVACHHLREVTMATDEETYPDGEGEAISSFSLGVARDAANLIDHAMKNPLEKDGLVAVAGKTPLRMIELAVSKAAGEWLKNRCMRINKNSTTEARETIEEGGEDWILELSRLILDIDEASRS